MFTPVESDEMISTFIVLVFIVYGTSLAYRAWIFPKTQMGAASKPIKVPTLREMWRAELMEWDNEVAQIECSLLLPSRSMEKLVPIFPDARLVLDA